MPLDFPSSPTLNDKYSSGGRNWTWNGTTWTLDSYVGVVPAGAVDTTQLANSAVTTAKLADASITAVKLPAGATNGKALLANSGNASGLEWGQAGSPADDGSAVISSQVFS
jgi:hypothetical protein